MPDHNHMFLYIAHQACKERNTEWHPGHLWLSEVTDNN